MAEKGKDDSGGERLWFAVLLFLVAFIFVRLFHR